MPRLVPLAFVLFVTACAEPERPVFTVPGEDPDVSAPLIIFAGPRDSVITIGDTLTVSLQVFDRSGIVVVTAAVSGALNFGFANAMPNDSIFEAQYAIPTSSAAAGILNFSVTAVDSVGNQTAALRRFTLQ